MEDKKSSMMLMKPPKIKNKAAADFQITAEQLLIDAAIHQSQDVKPPKQRIMDEDELESYKYKKRKEFENSLRRQKHHFGTWVKYATWEENLQEFRRARSIFERALDIDYKNVTLYLRYAEMEMRHKFINHARNIWERACQYLPRVDQFWYKYAYMEEMLGNYARARAIFEKWMTWHPPENSWMSYVDFEKRMGEMDNCRKVMYRYLEAYPTLKNFIKVTKFEIKQKNNDAARLIFERVMKDLGEEALNEEYFTEFAKFELRNKEIERAREIYRHGLENIPKSKATRLYEAYVAFEKQYGKKDEIDLLIIDKRRLHYKDIIKANPLNYDAWFDLIYLELSAGDRTRIRDTFEAAVLNVPLGNEKIHFRRYIYLWLNYAVFEELNANDLDRTKAVFERALKLIPHEKFTFSKLWIMYAHFYLRCKDLEMARKVFGNAIGRCSNEKIFQAYIDLELQLANVDRCRKLYEKWLELFPQSPTPWIKYAELEKNLEELERARGIFEVAIQQEDLAMPENVWRAFIDLEISLEEHDRVRALYRRLLEKTKHIKVWLAFADFEASIPDRDGTRKVYEEADAYFKENPELKEERLMLLEHWRDKEMKFGDKKMIEFVNGKMPKKVKKQRKLKVVEGEKEEDAGWEEYYDYIFPDDVSQLKNLKILQKAQMWKKAQEQNKTT